MAHDRHESADTGSSRSDDSDHQRQPADDVLLGATRIAAHLAELLGVPTTAADVYYALRANKLPIGKYGALLIASKRRLARHADELARGRPRHAKTQKAPQKSELLVE
jgi:hypothetical protein